MDAVAQTVIVFDHSPIHTVPSFVVLAKTSVPIADFLIQFSHHLTLESVQHNVKGVLSDMCFVSCDHCASGHQHKRSTRWLTNTRALAKKLDRQCRCTVAHDEQSSNESDTGHLHWRGTAN